MKFVGLQFTQVCSECKVSDLAVFSTDNLLRLAVFLPTKMFATVSKVARHIYPKGNSKSERKTNQLT